MEKVKRMENLDLMKAIAILMVITLHAALWKYDISDKSFKTPDLIQYSLRILSQGVPIFMAVNGFLLFKKKEIDLKRHYLKVLRLFCLFLFWTAFLYIIDRATNDSLSTITFSSILDTIAKANSSNAVTWFLQNLIAIYLIFPMLKLLYDQSKILFKILFFIVVTFTSGISIVTLADSILKIQMPLGTEEGLNSVIVFINRFSPIANGWFLLFFLLGGIILLNGELLKKHSVIFIILGFISIASSVSLAVFLSIKGGAIYNPDYLYASFFMPMIIIGLWALTLGYKSKGFLLSKLISGIGKNTFGIYLTHWIFIYLLRYFFSPELFWQRLLFYLAVVILSYLLTLLIHLIPGVRHIIMV